ncbi:uncharacterized protein LY89DRAFT_686368 [Mollisia scopiformis]|uniref:Uncharacterized protein n=1 Tax=Mollisia scopiformis TaxID=149040 RepID=A0A194X3F8_MOLSC|nr:uncharacterized protein LY89DRAFT_686368 [Mollisia scopiformis]KUJ14701.1 hypothetical protein LY89DRAFT_686368 [Mollisia scopiformis]
MPSAKASLKAMAKDAKSKKTPATPKKTTKQTSVPAPTNFKSTEYIQESDEEEDDEETKSETESDSDNDSLPANPADVTKNTNGKLPAPSGSSSSSDNESSSDESSGAESSGEDEHSDSSRRATVEPEPTKQRSAESSARRVAFDKPPTYKPPTGFETVSISDQSTASQILKKSNLREKQLWYFTAPASIPVSSIEQMSVADVDGGKTILSHDGTDYGFVQDPTGEKAYTTMFIPNSSEDAYLIASKSIDRVLHLQQTINIPGMNDADASLPLSSRATVPATKPVRQQPTGLKMRFRPIGFGAGKMGTIGSTSGDSSADGASDEEMEDAPAAFRRPVSEESDGEMEEVPPTSSKSKRKEKDKTAKSKSSPLKRKHGGRGH